MKDIVKNLEPVALTQYRAIPGAVYDGGNFTPVKDAIRNSQLDEQGHLCCYCMSRIQGIHEMRVEHWHSQTAYPAEQLDYGNLLAACCGNEGQSYSQQHCDVRKGDRELKYNPATPTHQVESRIRYLGNGTIESTDVEFQAQLEAVLNLNWSRLKNNRKSVIKAVCHFLNSKPGTRNAGQIKCLLDDWSTKDKDGRFKEYCGVAIYLLRKRLMRA